MRRRINLNIVRIVRLCVKYYKWGYGSSRMRDGAGIPWDILLKANCLALPEEVWEKEKWNPEEPDEIAEMLQGLVEELPERAGYVNISDYDGLSTEETVSLFLEKGYFYMWSVFCYTYKVTQNPDIQWEKFIWASVLLPYFYLLSKTGMATPETLKKMLADYPVKRGEDLTDVGLDWLKEMDCQGGKEIAKIISCAGVMGKLSPEKGVIWAVVNEAKAGLAAAIKIAGI